MALAPAGEVLNWNRAAETVFGWTAAEVMGRRLPCIPDDRQEEYDAFRAEVLGGASFTARETVRLRKDGTRFEMSISTSPIHDAAGCPVGSWPCTWT